MNERVNLIEISNADLSNSDIILQKKNIKRRISDRFKFILGLVIFSLVILGSIDILNDRTYIYELNNQNLQLESDLKSIQAEISEINVQINMQMSISNIKKLAQEEFGMINPSKDHIVVRKINRYYALNSDESPKINAASK